MVVYVSSRKISLFLRGKDKVYVCSLKMTFKVFVRSVKNYPSINNSYIYYICYITSSLNWWGYTENVIVLIRGGPTCKCLGARAPIDLDRNVLYVYRKFGKMYILRYYINKILQTFFLFVITCYCKLSVHTFSL